MTTSSQEQQKSVTLKFPQLFDFELYPELYLDLRQQMEGLIKPLLPIWTSPITNHHKYRITSVVFSPDGKTLASGSRDKTIKLWDVATGKEKDRFSGHKDSVTSVAFSPDGKTLASGSEDKTIKLWDVATGKR